MLIQLSEHDMRQYTKLHISREDIAFSRQCAAYIRKKGYFHKPWKRGNAYFHQCNYVTSLIVSYARPFSPGRGGHNFPKKLIPYNDAEMRLHNDICEKRNKISAHSDPGLWRLQPWKHEDVQTVITSQPDAYLSPSEIDCFLKMTPPLQSAIQDKMREIMSKY